MKYIHALSTYRHFCDTIIIIIVTLCWIKFVTMQNSGHSFVLSRFWCSCIACLLNQKTRNTSIKLTKILFSDSPVYFYSSRLWVFVCKDIYTTRESTEFLWSERIRSVLAAYWVTILFVSFASSLERPCCPLVVGKKPIQLLVCYPPSRSAVRTF